MSHQALRLNPTKLKKDAESRKCLKSLLFEIIDAGHRASEYYFQVRPSGEEKTSDGLPSPTLENEIEIHLAETEAKRLRRTIKQQEEIM